MSPVNCQCNFQGVEEKEHHSPRERYLFIYLELGAMVGIYFKTRRLPVQFLIYIAITALTRMLTIDIKGMPDKTILTVTGAILMLTLAILILRYTNTKLKEDNE
ncbi:phosphate-starvation-inducible protein PsiE [Candidatus Thiodiazotropha sp. LNASS1]|uniref:phosphate-starvation-inducible protein PsiE n=1 Tax=Candidatus Thiodiazotropha sp. LNASS1 TaxID=3096260 RepID=UPI00348A61F5